MPLHRLLYRSEVDLVGSAADVQQQIVEIVRSSEARNAADGLTGALLHTRGVFIQALEGPLSAIEATFERICCDLRHRRVELLELAQAEKRAFAEWSLARISADETMERLFPCLPSTEDQVVEATSAQATVRLMRALLVTSPTEAPAPQTLIRA
ncbi:BLUF domain-containing protein [Methylobacterium isbiliense]|uniref:BLUF domain-containing protein n=1 Tax=Methylobacterium isbiliense TaxID=315478 RepID=A0ABQ4SG60_9HYPH|nr:BLUF domain-containing protein [Methylobacterium isbiliense]MDN3627636.1 BLUF domain-containing protein [Methylobacterium isbiliense]GJE02216.1 hypothetical protein GMJLKIPL_4160 [Methylobacterium isbiliense]